MQAHDSQPVKVLFIDTENGILQSIIQLLRHENFEVLTAASGEEGLEIIKNTDDIGVVISDQITPTMSGVDLLSKVWELAPDSLRIMMTGYGGNSVEHEALCRGGVYRFISKPLKSDVFIKILRDAVTVYGHIREIRQRASHSKPLSRQITA